MGREVIGAGMMFLGSGCGPALSKEQRELLKDIQPDQFYPLDHLLKMFEAVQRTRPELIYATGRRWGNAVKDDMVKRGAASIKQALHLVASVYQEHHRGDVGELIVEDDGDEAIVLTNKGPYPGILIAGAYEALAAAMGADEVDLEHDDDPQRYRIAWKSGG